MITIGTDEVGRGCWAGPLVAGAVAISVEAFQEENVPAIRDSKKLSQKQRVTADAWIQTHALAIGLGWVTPLEIDTLGLTEAVRLAFVRALGAIKLDYDEIIVDGNINYFADNPKARAIVKADATIPAVSAASIVAKVARDTYMANLEERYTGYGFGKHVGYGTAAHIAALKSLGVSDMHRRSYKPIQLLLS